MQARAPVVELDADGHASLLSQYLRSIADLEQQVREQLEVTLGVKLTERKQAIHKHIKSFQAGTLAEPPEPGGDGGGDGRRVLSRMGGGSWRGRGWMRPGAPLDDAGVHHTYHGAPRVQGFVASGALWLVGSDALQPPLGAHDDDAAATRYVSPVTLASLCFFAEPSRSLRNQALMEPVER
jgi:hypothetical protein